MARVKKREYENLSDSNVKKVIDLLSQEKPITKKDACEILNISYNTSRLQKIIEEFQDKQAYAETRRKQNKGKSAQDHEIKDAIEQYLSGTSVSVIAKRLYRSPSFVKNIIERLGVPSKPTAAEDKTKITILPDSCCAESFEEGDIVWSARHHKPARIEKEVSLEYQKGKKGFSALDYEKKYDSKCYAIYVFEEINEDKEFWIQGINTGGYSAFALAYDLGKLTHLEKCGVNLSRV
jgi:transposase